MTLNLLGDRKARIRDPIKGLKKSLTSVAISGKVAANSKLSLKRHANRSIYESATGFLRQERRTYD
jgi:hypothetical protein